MLDGSDRKRFQ